MSVPAVDRLGSVATQLTSRTAEFDPRVAETYLPFNPQIDALRMGAKRF